MLQFLNNNLNITIKNISFRYGVRKIYQETCRKADGLIFYVSGGHEFTFPNKKFVVQNGQFVFLPINAKYQNRTIEKNVEYFQIDIIAKDDQGNIVSVFDSPFYSDDTENNEILSCFKSAYENYTTIRQSDFINSYINILKIISILQNKDDSIKFSHPDLFKIQKSISYIDQNYMKQTPISEIAALSNMCISNFEKIFYKCFGITASQYRNNVRLKHAKCLLSCGKTMDETAELVGFCDVYYFYKIFKKIEGKTPGKFIKESIKL